MNRRVLTLTTVAVILLSIGVLLYIIIDDNETACGNPVDKYKGGTAKQWNKESEDWQRISLKYEAVVKQYRDLNTKLLGELGQ